MKFYFPFPFSDKIFCDIQHVMNRRNIIAGSRTVRLISTPAALLYHAVLCCIFAVSLSIIHETQIPFTFFRDFLKKVFGALSVSQSSIASGLNLSVTGFAVTAPLVGEPLAGRRVFGVWRFAPFGSAGVMFASAAEVGLGADRRKDRKKRPHHSKEQWGRFTILQWVPLIQPWGLREPLPPQPLRRALPERQERQRASEPASPRAWGDSDRPSAGRG